MSPLLDSPPTEKSRRTRTDTRTPQGAFGGTDVSSPASSSGESDANSRRRSGANTAGCRGRRSPNAESHPLVIVRL
jgi:hypothetical protein